MHKQGKGIFYFQHTGEYLPLTTDNEAKFWQEVITQPDNNPGFRFVYLAFSSDERPTLFLIKQRFTAGNEENVVGVFNNIRPRDLRYPIRPPFVDYQEFHRDQGQIRSWVQWLHVRPGLISNRDLINTMNAPLPRRQFAFKDEQHGDDLKAYLILVSGINPRGSCVDFKPTVSRKTHGIEISITNLRPTETGDPRDPYFIWVRRQ
jgi:hypothetical protein